jgi:hypothetical protein
MAPVMSSKATETAPVRRKRFWRQGVLALAWLAPLIIAQDEPYLDVTCDYDTCWKTFCFEVRAACGGCPGQWFAMSDATWVECVDHFTGPQWSGDYEFWLDLDDDCDVDMADMAMYQPTFGDYWALNAYFH